VGPFGAAVARLLASALPSSALFGSDLDAAFASGSGPVLVALWRPSPALCDRADRLAYDSGRMVIPIVMEHPTLRIGPVIDPPIGPCYGCYTARRAQHNTALDASAALERAFDRDPGFGPLGYLPAHARAAAGVAAGMIARVGRGGQHAGEVVTLDWISGTMSRTTVVQCGDCPRAASSSSLRADLGRIGHELAAASVPAGGQR
jgi:bacteriocin biosynthesis cyclodehydratase domain-containing protein